MTATSTNHLEAWLTEDDAAERLNISVRTLRRKTAAGEGPEKRERRRPGVRPEAVYNPDDVARLALTPPTVFAPTSQIGLRAPELQKAAPPQIAVFEQLASLLHTRVLAQPRPTARWMTMKQAAEATGLSVTLIRRLIASGRLRAIRDGALKVLEADLANLDNVAELAGLAVTRSAGGGE